MSTKKITTVGMLCAMAMIVNVFISFPIVPAVSFLRYDPKDILSVIGGFIYGPMTSLLMSFICSIFEIMLKGGNILDVLMNMVSTCSFACMAAFVYKKVHNQKGAVLGLVLGVMCTTISMLIWNYIITPIYYGMPRSAIVPMLLPGILPFNLIKATMNAAIVFFLYKPVVQILRRSHLVEKSDRQGSVYKGYVFVVGVVLVTMILFVLGYQGII